MKHIALLGSTGSVGKQVLQVIDQFPDEFSIGTLTANRNAELLIRQAIQYKPDRVVISDSSKYHEVKQALLKYGIAVSAGEEALSDIVQFHGTDFVLSAIVGYAGLLPALQTIEAGKTLALANKETLVIAGELIMKRIKEKKTIILPVDSEHSAIFQCLLGEPENSVEKIILTASGGPFLHKDIQSLQHVTRNETLAHPVWNMGEKITVDSATMINKGFEAIEAKWLFNLHPDQIDVIIHPQSVIHSAVQFKDGSLKAQISIPDMKFPILYALSYPKRFKTNFARLRFSDYPSLTFITPDTHKFPALALAFESMRKGGNMPCILNAANEVAVLAFLQEKINFVQITETIEHTFQKMSLISHPSLTDLIETDREARKIADFFIGHYNR